MKKKKIIFGSFGVVVLLLLGLIGYNILFIPNRVFPHGLVYENELSMDEIIVKEKALEDFNSLINKVESVHPIFIDGCLNEDEYKKQKEQCISKISKDMSVRDLKLILSQYMCYFEDGHTKIDWYNSNEVLNANIDYINNDLCVVNNSSIKPIDKLNGIDVNKVLSFINDIYPSENINASYSNYAYFSKIKSVLDYVLDCDLVDINITYKDGTEETFSFTKNEYIYEKNSFYYLDSTLVIDFNECVVDYTLDVILSEIALARQNNIKNFIIDARDNGGGNSTASKKLLEALGMKCPQFGTLIRCSKETSYQIGYLKTFGSYESKGSLDSYRNEDVNLYALCNRDTFSSATMLLTYIRDGNLGTIIGEGSANKPSSYGDIFCFQLPNSKITGTISHKKFLRPNKEVVENMLVPDYVTSSSEALKKALELINK